MGALIAAFTFIVIGSHQWGISEGIYVERKEQNLYCSPSMSVSECRERIKNKGPSNVEKVEIARRGHHEE